MVHTGYLCTFLYSNPPQLLYSCVLQYVISPGTSNGLFSTEVWIELQHMTVSGTPQKLKYLVEKNVLDIHYYIGE